MTPQTWQPVTLLTDTIPAHPDSLWTPVLEYVEGPIKLKFVATGTWEPVKGGSPCSPDGDAASPGVDDALSKAAPIGALIAKVGGSTADRLDADKGSVFAVGSFCVIALSADQKGALFLTMNDRVNWFHHHAGTVSVKLFEAK
jgi:hypothetical protein